MNIDGVRVEWSAHGRDNGRILDFVKRGLLERIERVIGVDGGLKAVYAIDRREGHDGKREVR